MKYKSIIICTLLLASCKGQDNKGMIFKSFNYDEQRNFTYFGNERKEEDKSSLIRNVEYLSKFAKVQSGSWNIYLLSRWEKRRMPIIVLQKENIVMPIAIYDNDQLKSASTDDLREFTFREFIIDNDSLIKEHCVDKKEYLTVLQDLYKVIVIQNGILGLKRPESQISFMDLNNIMHFNSLMEFKKHVNSKVNPVSNDSLINNSISITERVFPEGVSFGENSLRDIRVRSNMRLNKIREMSAADYLLWETPNSEVNYFFNSTDFSLHRLTFLVKGDTISIHPQTLIPN